MFDLTFVKKLLFGSCLMCVISCSEEIAPDLILKNATVWTGVEDQAYSRHILIKEGKILEIGSDEVLAKANEQSQIVELNNAFVMPGIIEGHGHFSGLGKSLIKLNLLKTKSWDEIIKMVEEKVKESKPGEWIEGRGWHQEKWLEAPHEHLHGYPFHYELSAISPDNPVLLYHASGHSLFANKKAMELSGVTSETNSPMGGEIVRDFDGHAIGVFEERAMSIIRETFQAYEASLTQEERDNYWKEAIEKAQEECLKKGITSFQDAGSSVEELRKYEEMATNGDFDLRLWVMVRDSLEKIRPIMNDLRKVNHGDGFYTCNAVKTEIDGALGSYGAWLLEPYADKADFYGQNTTDLDTVKAFAELAKANKMQLCVHAIGDRGNQEILNMMEDLGHEPEWRWRIEHSQHLATSDISRFGKMGVIPSMQGVHCTSDSPFVEKRLGEKRAREGAYPWRSLLDSGAVVTNGTDAPVEDVDPLESIYATVTRKRVGSEEAFFPEQCMTRLEALRSYTISNAFAAFEEKNKGSLEKGKLADVTILDTNLLTCREEDILSAKILYTIVNGEIKFSSK